VKLWQLAQGYRYNSDSLILYDFISRIGYEGNILDVGCGCGILGALLKRDKPKISLTLLDIQPINVTITKHNMQFNHLDGQVIEGDFLKTQWDTEFDMIVSNPPYYHDGVTQSMDEHLAPSRYNRYLPISEFFLYVNRALKPRGRLLFCYDAKQIGAVISELIKNSLTPQVLQFVHSKADKNATLVLVEARKNSKSLCTTFSPIIVNENGAYSKMVQAIFDKADTKSHQWE